jgi:hypothetical protein
MPSLCEALRQRGVVGNTNGHTRRGRDLDPRHRNLPKTGFGFVKGPGPPHHRCTPSRWLRNTGVDLHAPLQCRLGLKGSHYQTHPRSTALEPGGCRVRASPRVNSILPRRAVVRATTQLATVSATTNYLFTCPVSPKSGGFAPASRSPLRTPHRRLYGAQERENSCGQAGSARPRRPARARLRPAPPGARRCWRAAQARDPRRAGGGADVQPGGCALQGGRSAGGRGRAPGPLAARAGGRRASNRTLPLCPGARHPQRPPPATACAPETNRQTFTAPAAARRRA